MPYLPALLPVKQGGDCNDNDASINPAGKSCDSSNENEAPVITILNHDPEKQYYAIGQEYVFTVQVTDPNAGDPITLTAKGYEGEVNYPELTISPSLPLSISPMPAISRLGLPMTKPIMKR